MAFPFVDAVQFIPSEEYARRFVPIPPATQIDPLYATAIECVNKAFPLVEKVQFFPSDEYASVFVPFPPATMKFSVSAVPTPDAPVAP